MRAIAGEKKRGTNQAPLRRKLEELESALAAIGQGKVDALLVSSAHGDRVVALNEAADPYRSLVEKLVEGALVLLDDGTISYANLRFAESVGLPLPRVIGADLRSFLTPADRPFFDRMLANGQSASGEFTLLGPDDIRNPVRISLSPLAGSAAGFAATVSDLSEARQTREILDNLLRHLPNLMVTAWNSAGIFTKAAGWMLKGAALKPEQVVGKSILKPLTGPHPDIVARRRRVLAGEQVTETAEFGGHIIDLRLTPVKDARGTVIGGVMAGTDITERVRAERELKRRVAEEAAIAAFGQQVLEGRAIEELVGEAARTVAGTLEVELCVVLEMVDEDTGVVASVGGTATVDRGTRVKLTADRHALRAIAADEGVAVADYAASKEFGQPPWLARIGVKSGLTAPVPDNERPYGIIGAYSHQSRSFSHDDIRFVQTIANILAQAIKRKRAENDLRRGEEYYRSLIENVSDVISVIEPSGKLLYSSGSVRAVLGRPPGTTLGMNVFDQHHPSCVERLREGYSRALATPGEPIGVESRVHHEDGSWRDVEIVLQATTSLSGDPVLVSTMRDITERKRVEQERALLASIVDSSEDAISSRDLEGRVTSWNPGAERLFGYTAAEMIGRTFGLLALPQDEMQANFRKVLESGRPQHFENRLGRKDGSQVDVATTLSPLRDSNGDIAGVVLVTHDISERRLAERARELAAANTELEQFAYVASHDLKEPLRMISGFAGLLKRRLEQNPDDREALEFACYIEDGAQRSQELIDALLDYATIAPSSETFEQVDVGIVVGEVLVALDPALTAANARVIREPMPVVSGDQTLLAQLFQNLIGNAIKFRSERPLEIHLSASREGSHWVFAVRDNGIGIEPGSTERIFNMFERLHNRKQFPGRGMGLAICKKAVERLGGRIWVESEPGVGSTFRFSLPA